MTHETVKETEGADRRVQAVRETKGVGSGSIRLSDSGSLRIDDLGSVPCECKGAGRATERRDVDQYVVMVLRCLRSEEHTSELQSHLNLVCRLLLEKKK